MKYKTIELKADETGKIAGFFSTYDKTPDSYGDIIEPGAFDGTVERRKATGHPFPICFNHDFSAVIGACDVELAEKGPLMSGDFLDTHLAQDVRKMVQSGAIYQFSFAYDVLGSREPSADEKAAGVANVLTEVEVYEISVVTVPANQNAVITDIKSAINAEIKAGRRNRKSDEDIIKQIIELARSLLDEPEDIEEEPEQTEEIEMDANGAPEEQKSNENSARAERLLEKIKTMKGDPEDES